MRRVSRETDHNWEVACLAKWMYQALPIDQRFGLCFDNIKGSDISVVTGALGASPASVAIALQCGVDEINQTVVEALRRPVKPRVVDEGRCQEVVYLGREASLRKLPIVTWTPRKDAAPYLTTIVVTRDHDSGIANMAVYRTMVRNDHSVVVNLSPNRQGTRNVKSWTDKGKKAPIAWVIAAEPAVHLATVANLPYGRDEIELAGALMGEAVSLVRCKTIDLLVPGNAEIIVEAEIAPGETDNEGPFGEFAGYMGVVDRRPVAHVTALTHRKDPIFYGYTSQMPPSESTTIQSLMNAGVIQQMLWDHLGEQSVTDVWIDLTFGGLLAHCIVAMTPNFPGHGKKVGRIIADATLIKRVTVVNSDVDIRDPTHIEWAMNARFSPQRDTVLIDDVYVPLQIDPSVRNAYGVVTQGSKMIVDATLKIDSGPFSLPPKDLMLKALEVWKASGLPEFQIPKRASLRLENS